MALCRIGVEQVPQIDRLGIDGFELRPHAGIVGLIIDSVNFPEFPMFEFAVGFFECGDVAFNTLSQNQVEQFVRQLLHHLPHLRVGGVEVMEPIQLIGHGLCKTQKRIR